MERIQAAIQKAKEQRGEAPADASPSSAAPRGVAGTSRTRPTVWAQLEAFEPNPNAMEQHRIVTFAEKDASHTTFDMMRTKILRVMRQNGWTSLGVTSPTAGCGKTTVALNLAFSLARQPELRTVLLDLDLRRPTVARHLGLPTGPQAAADLLRGVAQPTDSFVRYGENLAIAGNSASARSSAELLLGPSTAKAVANLKSAFQPDLLLYDLPPVLLSDDAMAFLPHLDCVLLIAAAEKSRLDEVDRCEQDLAEQTNVLGVVLNMCRYMDADYGYY